MFVLKQDESGPWIQQYLKYISNSSQKDNTIIIGVIVLAKKKKPITYRASARFISLLFWGLETTQQFCKSFRFLGPGFTYSMLRYCSC